MKKPICVVENRARVKLLMDHVREMGEKTNDLSPMTDPDEWQAAIESTLHEIRKLHGQHIGMQLARDPENSRLNALVEAYIEAGNNYHDITDGLAEMQKEIDADTAGSDADRRAEAWGALSTTEQRELEDQQRRQRVASGMGLPGERR